MNDSLLLCDLIIAAIDTVQSRHNINTPSLELAFMANAAQELLEVRYSESAQVHLHISIGWVYGTMQVTPDLGRLV